MTLSTQYPRLADPSDIPRLISGSHVHHEWPPPGCTVLPIAAPERWIVVSGQPTTGSDGDWWLTDLAHVALELDSTVAQVLSQLAREFTGPIAQFVGVAGQWPVIFTQGQGDVMRWISSTFRGTLAGVEQFQFGINWGNPGADPDPNESEALSFAEELRDSWQSQLATMEGDQALLTMFPPDVKFTEVGVTKKTQTSGTSSDGSGGDLEQAYDTQWAPYSVGSLPTGAASSVTLPFEVACAVTLQTEKRGPSGRGRLYLPPFGVGYVASGGKFTASTIATAGRAIGGLFETITASRGYVPVVVSRRRIVLNEVTSISVGVVPDSQRRRRRSQDEARVVEWVKP